MSTTLTRRFQTNLTQLDNNEAGMEAAQVILILFLVVIGLIPIIVLIKDKLASKASSVDNSINGFG